MAQERNAPVGSAFDRLSETVIGVSPRTFSAWQHITKHPERYVLTSAFRKSGWWRLAPQSHDVLVAVKSFVLLKGPKTLKASHASLSINRKPLHPTYVIECLDREYLSETRVFSAVHPNYIRMGARTWMKVSKGRRDTWTLDAVKSSDGSHVIHNGAHVIVRIK